ncbi:uncharacterized protein pdgfbb isoform X2 [Silurus meridionalis]|nr:uncharacterized protein pdgfbb isoform X2 [Silurus meridionalis]
MEVTRSMLDRSNANFLLWPPCVEVQRCSGCCNTKNLKCVAVLTHTRYLQVMKIQYMNMRPVYNKAVVSVNDHVECRCQAVPRPSSRRKSTASKQEARDRSGKPRFKDELHRRDELKPNQRLKLEDLLSHSWPPLENGQDAWSHNNTQLRMSRGYSFGDGRKSNSSSNDTKGWSSERQANPIPSHINKENTGLIIHNVLRASEKVGETGDKGVQTNSTINDDRLINQSLGVHPTEITNQIPQHESETIQCTELSKTAKNSQVHKNHTTSQMETTQNQTHSGAHAGQANQTMVSKPAEKTNQKQGHGFNAEKEPSVRTKGNETPEMESTQEETEGIRSRSTLLKEIKALEEEKEELLLLHKRLDEEKLKHFLKAQNSPHEDQKQHPMHHKPQQTHTTTQRTESRTTTPVRLSTPHTPPRLPPRPPKRSRKHRNRISKAVMRAMLM